MKSRSSFSFSGSEPFFQGHFPAAPILPGVVQLMKAREIAEEMLGHKIVLKAVKRMKFMAVIQPADKIDLELEGEEGEMTYRFFKGEVLCSSGVLEF